jgi:hypothetical protein
MSEEGSSRTPTTFTKGKDPVWDFGLPLDKKKKRVQCTWCTKQMSGGINRLKYHLAGIKGEVEPCDKVEESVRKKIRKDLESFKEHKLYKRNIVNEIGSFVEVNDNDMDLSDESDESTEKRYIKGKKLMNDAQKHNLDAFVQVKAGSLSMKQLGIKAALDRKARDRLCSAIARFFYHSAIPFNAANSPYFTKMIEVCSSVGMGLKPPSSSEISGRLLQEEIKKLMIISKNTRSLGLKWVVLLWLMVGKMQHKGH